MNLSIVIVDMKTQNNEKPVVNESLISSLCYNIVPFGFRTLKVIIMANIIRLTILFEFYIFVEIYYNFSFSGNLSF